MAGYYQRDSIQPLQMIFQGGLDHLKCALETTMDYSVIPRDGKDIEVSQPVSQVGHLRPAKRQDRLTIAPRQKALGLVALDEFAVVHSPALAHRLFDGIGIFVGEFAGDGGRESGPPGE